MTHLLAQADIYTQFFQGHPDSKTLGGSLGRFASSLLPNILIVAGILLLFLIIYGGFQLIILGGQFNSPSQVSKSKSMVTYAFIGFLLVVSAYFILQIVSTVTGVDFTNIPSTL